MVTDFVGDLMNSKANYICHQVNCAGAMNSGVAKCIRQKFPVVFEAYKVFCSSKSNLLGECLIVQVGENQSVANLFGQNDFGYDGKQYTDYIAIKSALIKLEGTMKEKESVAFPYKMSSDRGGAAWDVIKQIILEIFEEKYDIEFWRLPG